MNHSLQYNSLFFLKAGTSSAEEYIYTSEKHVVLNSNMGTTYTGGKSVAFEVRVSYKQCIVKKLNKKQMDKNSICDHSKKS